MSLDLRRLLAITENRYPILVVIIIAAAALRLFGIAEHALWNDERVSVSNAVGSVLSEPIASSEDGFTSQNFWSGNTITGVVRATVIQDGGNNLLFNTLLHYWIQVCGTRDFAVRLLSALFGTLVVLLVYKIAKVLFSERVAYIASILTAFHPMLIRYSQETRSYAFATSLSLAATLVFINLTGLCGRRANSERNSWLYGAVVGASLLTHYLTGYVFIGHVLFAAARIRDRRVWSSLIKAAALATVIVGLWVFVGGKRGLEVIAEINHNYQLQAEHPSLGEAWTLPATPHYLVAGGVQSVLAMTGNSLQSAGLRLSSLAPLLIVPFSLFAISWRTFAKQANRSALLLIAALASASLACSAVLAIRSGHIVAFQPLYASFGTPYVLMLLALGISGIGALRLWRRYLAVGMVLAQTCIVVVSLRLVYDDSPWLRPPNPYVIVTDQLAKIAARDDVIVYPSWVDARICNLYIDSANPTLQRVEVRPESESDSIRIVSEDSKHLELVHVPRDRMR